MSRRARPLSGSPLYIGSVDTPVGRLWIAVSEQGIVAIDWAGDQEDFCASLQKRFRRPCLLEPARVEEAARQLNAYFEGQRQSFDLPIDWSGMTPFQQEVLRATLTIPYGGTRTYLDLARQIGRPNAARAVGRAEASNPIPILIPCHRVIGRDGKLHGYGGGEGIKTKAFLLELEKAILP
uniref:Methylated-DNA--protein-cysteine methyltransferase n=1 Tax=uncultured Chloroflexota bacterium TaxID=166587 RepID=H5SLB0_9CHLR|nr:methylated-DNA--protein-cysteine methyltransferase [uncultured Chloroflexota bacterium]